MILRFVVDLIYTRKHKLYLLHIANEKNAYVFVYVAKIRMINRYTY